MSLLVRLLVVVVMMMMKASAGVTVTVLAHSGSSVLLSSDQLKEAVENGWDIRWTHPNLMLNKNKTTKCHHGRCELLEDGSLHFSQVRPDDSGNYSLRVYDKNGKVKVETDFLLKVEADTGPQWSLISLLILLLLPLLVIILFILRRRRNQREMITGPMERNVYVSMHRRHSNRRKVEEEKQEKEEESVYVACQLPVSTETPIKQQMTEEAEDIYV